MPFEGTEPLDPILGRLDEQAIYYEERATTYRRAFKGLKTLQILAASSIPVGVALSAPPSLSAILGALVVVVEGLLQLNQYQPLWVSYRATAESLKRERSLYGVGAAPYAVAADPRVLLAERVEALLAHEIGGWVTIRRDAGKGKEQKADRQ